MMHHLLNNPAPEKLQSNLGVDVHITQKAYTKLRYYINECPTEISGFGKVKEFEYVDRRWEEIMPKSGFTFPKRKKKYILNEYAKKGLLVYDVEILPQTATGGHASIDPDTIAKFMTEKMAAGEPIGDYKVWWHSHVFFEAFFSSTDLKTIKESTEFPYLLSIVMNKQGESQARLDINGAFPRYSYVDIKVRDAENPELRESIKEEIAQKVTEPNPKNLLRIYQGEGVHGD